MSELFSDIPEALENNYNLPFRCSFRPVSSKPILPNISSEKGINSAELLIKDSNEGLIKKFEIFFKRNKEQLENTISTHYLTSYDLYKNMLAAGIAKECAREVLPMGTPTRLYMNGTLRSWVHYVELRSGHGTQKEHMEVARACAQAIEPIFPMIKEFVDKNRITCVMIDDLTRNFTEHK